MRVRTWLIASLFALVPAGFTCKLYDGPCGAWVRNSLAGVLYEIFWILLLAMVFSRRAWIPRQVAVVFVATCLLEFLQLWHPPFLEAIRRSYLGKALIGTHFVWLDFPHYAIGCVAGWIWALSLPWKS